MATVDPTAQNEGFPFTFHGAYTRAVDVKGRFNLPFRFRKGGPADEEEKYVVTRGADGALALMPHEVWRDNFNRLRQGQPGPELRDYLRRMSQASHVVAPDSQGRIAVPGDFLQAGGVDRKVTVVGMGNYMELWDPQLLAAKMDEPPISDENLTDEFFR